MGWGLCMYVWAGFRTFLLTSLNLFLDSIIEVQISLQKQIEKTAIRIDSSRPGQWANKKCIASDKRGVCKKPAK